MYWRSLMSTRHDEDTTGSAGRPANSLPSAQAHQVEALGPIGTQ